MEKNQSDMRESKIEYYLIEFYKLVTIPFFFIYCLIYTLIDKDLRAKMRNCVRNRDSLTSQDDFYELHDFFLVRYSFMMQDIFIHIFYFCLLVLLFNLIV